ncbi:hypothetical protein ACFGVR_13715 [Mucilaginibacter sp. AW1-3]
MCYVIWGEFAQLGQTPLDADTLKDTTENFGVPKATANLINKYPDRFLLGTDEVAPSDQKKYLKIYCLYKPLFAQLTPEVKQKLTKGNYQRIFDTGRIKLRAWEKAHLNDKKAAPRHTPSSGAKL